MSLIGRKQTQEHIQKRTISMSNTRRNWTREQYEAARLSNSRAHIGQIAWNKGNNWRDKLSPEEVKNLTAFRARKRRLNNPDKRIHDRLSTLIRLSLKHNKNGKSWEGLTGYTIEQLTQHLKKTIPDGYTWQDYIDGVLQLDHIIPRSAFHFVTVEDIDFKRCWALKNLQLLPSVENNRKKKYHHNSFSANIGNPNKQS